MPPLVAGAALGVRQRTMQDWLTHGSAEAIMEKPKNPKQRFEITKEWAVTLQEWYEHTLECKKLADTVLREEGQIVGSLVKRMHKNSMKNPIMMQFLFKHYSSVHGMLEPKSTKQMKDSMDMDDAEHVFVHLPDNGRAAKAS